MIEVTLKLITLNNFALKEENIFERSIKKELIKNFIRTIFENSSLSYKQIYNNKWKYELFS